MDLTGKRAFVTGGSGDIGGAIARALAGAGVDVAVSYVGNTDGADRSIAAIRACGRKGFAVRLDQRDPTSIADAAEKVRGEFGGLDILVNNAGWNIGIPFKDLETLNEDIWDRVLETNLRGPFLLSRALAGSLRESGSGRIINIASVGGLIPGSSSIAYSSSKAGLIHLTRCLAVALAPDVTVNCIAPGLVENTRMARNLPEKQANAARRQAVLGKVGSADDIAEQALVFCRTETITGQLMVVDGGMPGCMH
ncbi:SDR family oxidoreductase [bacterium]|nr:SDR family oxidoreductase [bacterium]